MKKESKILLTMLTLIFVMSAAVLIGEPVNAAPIPPAPTGLH